MRRKRREGGQAFILDKFDGMRGQASPFNKPD
jgi:hypothetical protein